MNPESKNKLPDKLPHRLTDLLFYSVMFVFIVALAFPHNPAGNWYQQFLPSIGGRQINDITFTDSLNGFAVTNEVSDTSFVLRTTNGGDSWSINHFDTGICSYYSVQFINSNTGFVSGFIYNGSNYRLLKTTNSGNTWIYIDHTSDIVALDMHVLSVDTIWVVDSGSLTGGVYRTTNGGASWDQQLNLGNQNPNHIYMFNTRIGFISEANSYLRRTTNSGLNWDIVPNDNGFRDMFFIDSLKGWKCGTETDSVRATTNGGSTWFKQLLPATGGFFNISAITDFAFVNKDTIYGVGPRAGTTLGFRGMIYKTVNGGQNWGYQIPDTNTINISRYSFVDFFNKNNGWAYAGMTGVHTTNGGDPIWYIGIQQISSNIPKEYELKQNYPNPFNPRTVIPFSLKRSAYVKLIAYDITGREIQKMVEGKYSVGEYEADFMGKFTASGVYFYRMEVKDDASKQLYTEVKKMILLK
jgi:photosystem II stability/assembly factor-like uncharacterized protein